MPPSRAWRRSSLCLFSLVATVSLPDTAKAGFWGDLTCSTDCQAKKRAENGTCPAGSPQDLKKKVDENNAKIDALKKSLMTPTNNSFMCNSVYCDGTRSQIADLQAQNANLEQSIKAEQQQQKQQQQQDKRPPPDSQAPKPKITCGTNAIPRYDANHAVVGCDCPPHAINDGLGNCLLQDSGGGGSGGGGTIASQPATTCSANAPPGQCSPGETAVQGDDNCWKCVSGAAAQDPETRWHYLYDDQKLVTKDEAKAWEAAAAPVDGSKVGLGEIEGWKKHEDDGNYCTDGQGNLTQQCGKDAATNSLPEARELKLQAPGTPSASQPAPLPDGTFQIASLILAPQERMSGYSMPTGGLGGWTEQDKDDTQAHDVEGMLRSAEDLLRDHQYDKALTLLEAAAMVDPNNPRLQKDLSITYNRLHRWDDAVLAAVKAFRLSPKDPVPLQEFAWAKLHLDKPEEALDAAKRAIALDPKNAWSHVLAALAYERLGDRDDMIKELEIAARLDPKYQGHLDRALAGMRLFDPNDSDKLFGDLGPLKGGANPYGQPERIRVRSSGFLATAARAVKSKPAAGGLLLVLCGAAFFFWPDLVRLLRRQARPRLVVPDASPSAEVARVGRYELLGAARESRLGTVWEARDPGLGRPVSITRVSLAGGPGGAARRAAVLSDARLLSALQHPGILPLYDVLDLADGIFLVHGAATGRTLGQILGGSKGMLLEGARRILVPACRALEYAHSRGVTHRNLGPDSFLVAEDGKVLLTDFGLGAPMVGLYSAPEAAQGMATPASDVYSLGVCLFQALTGRLPFGEEPAFRAAGRPFPRASALVPGLPAEVDELIAAATRPALQERTPSPAEFAARLEKVVPAVTAAS